MSKIENLIYFWEKIVVHDHCDENALISVFVRNICYDNFLHILYKQFWHKNKMKQNETK
jgi:hypothetical protein